MSSHLSTNRPINEHTIKAAEAAEKWLRDFGLVVLEPRLPHHAVVQGNVVTNMRLKKLQGIAVDYSVYLHIVFSVVDGVPQITFVFYPA